MLRLSFFFKLGIAVANTLFSYWGEMGSVTRTGIPLNFQWQTQHIHHVSGLFGTIKEFHPGGWMSLLWWAWIKPRSYLNIRGVCSSVLIIGQLQLFLWSCCWQHLSNLTLCGLLEHSLLTPTQRRDFKTFPLKFIQSKQIFFSSEKHCTKHIFLHQFMLKFPHVHFRTPVRAQGLNPVKALNLIFVLYERVCYRFAWLQVLILIFHMVFYDPYKWLHTQKAKFMQIVAAAWWPELQTQRHCLILPKELHLPR